MNDDARPALTRFEFTSGLQRGSHLLLYPRCLVHRGDSEIETVSFAHVNSVRGRDTLLLDFAEALSERLMLLKR